MVCSNSIFLLARSKVWCVIDNLPSSRLITDRDTKFTTFDDLGKLPFVSGLTAESESL
jgi:hypothetical protein